MTKRPLILISNDDGIHAPGIKHLWEAVREMGDIYVVAPLKEQSGVGLGITTREPLHLRKVDWQHSENVWSVSGTPADCVKLARTVILPRAPDLIVSGINRGSNAGRNVLYSGTVAAVIEGVMQHIPGIAFSTGDYKHASYKDAEAIIPNIVDYVLKNPLPFGTFLNVNFPEKKHGKVKGIRLTKQGKGYLIEDPEVRLHPFEDEPYYWMGAKQAVFEEDEDCDISWLDKGYVSVVPIHVSNLTHHAHLEQDKQAFELHLN